MTAQAIAAVRAQGWAVQLTAPVRYQATIVLPNDRLTGVTLTAVIEGATLETVLAAAELAGRAMIAAGILPGQ
jgi:hypothetical protein